MKDNYFKRLEKMKKAVNLFLSVAILSIAMVVACQDKGSDSSALTLDKTDIEVLSPGGMTLISVNTDLTWNASVNADWVNLTPAAGSGSGAVTVKIDSCVGLRRTAEIVFVSGAVTKTVNILQKGNQKDDYYKTGEVLKLHRHSVGNGIAIIIIGDGFDREDCRIGGVYEYNCRKLKDLFLSMPVIRDYTAYFDVFARVDISREGGVRNCVAEVEAGRPENCPDNAYGVGHPDLNWDKIHANATLTAGKDARWVIFMGNGMIGGAAYLNSLAIYSANEPNKPYWMMHEFVGHAFGGLPDLYMYYGTGLMSDAVKKDIDDHHARGDYLMIDHEKDPNKVYWKDFINKDGYTNVGMYPGVYWDYLKPGEVVTCEDLETSVMCGPTNHYTVMERYQIWRRIQTYAGFTTITIDEFKEYDKANKIDSDWTWDRYDNWTDDRIGN